MLELVYPCTPYFNLFFSLYSSEFLKAESEVGVFFFFFPPLYFYAKIHFGTPVSIFFFHRFSDEIFVLPKVLFIY